MNMINRIKGILLTPKDEWIVIEEELTEIVPFLTRYLLPLSLIPAIASFIGYGLIGVNIPFIGHVGSMSLGIKYIITSLVTTFLGVLVSAYIIDALAPTFGGTRNLTNAVQLVGYSYTPTLIAGILFIWPALSVISLFAGIYGLYVLYLGIVPLMKSNEEKTTTYFIVSLLIIVLAFYFISAALFSILTFGS
ncbi:MAG: Yip1 family protein [Bacteroidota bacterium]|nr:Yip1 family protein [Bacteroidota bacterium]MDP4206190.1 Yip1 family protein [Bacteroidota bacterium]